MCRLTVAPNELLEEHDTAADSCALERGPCREECSVAGKVEQHARLSRELLAIVRLLEHNFSLDGQVLLPEQIVVRADLANSCQRRYSSRIVLAHAVEPRGFREE